ncbi:hypothetical protein V8B97DRAFT_2026405 [Scleroderma yunnanense]
MAYYIQEVLKQKSFKVMHGYHQSLYVKAVIPLEEVPLLYSPCKVFTSTLWVQVKSGMLLFNADAAQLAEHTVIVQKQMLEVVEVPQPNDLTFHLLVGINPPLLWQGGDLVQLIAGELRNTLGHILSAQKRGTCGCVLNHPGENLTLTVEVDPILVHLHMPNHMVSEVGRIVWVAPPTLWVEPLAHHKLLEEGHLNNMKPAGSGELPHKDNMISLRDLFTISMDDAQTEAAPMLTFLSQHGYDVTIGDVVKVMQGKNCGQTGTVLNVHFCKASMSIRCKDFMLNVHISSCVKISNWTLLLTHRGCEIKNIDIMTSMGYLLTRDKLDAAYLKALIALQQRSEQSESGKTNDSWTISPLDLTPVVPFDASIMPSTATPTVDKGMES